MQRDDRFLSSGFHFHVQCFIEIDYHKSSKVFEAEITDFSAPFVRIIFFGRDMFKAFSRKGNSDCELKSKKKKKTFTLTNYVKHRPACLPDTRDRGGRKHVRKRCYDYCSWLSCTCGVASSRDLLENVQTSISLLITKGFKIVFSFLRSFNIHVLLSKRAFKLAKMIGQVLFLFCVF